MAPLFKPGEIIVKYRSGKGKRALKESARRELRVRHGGSLKKPLKLIGAEVWTLKKGEADVPSLADELSQDPNVEYAHPNHIYYSDAIPDDPYFWSMWGLHNGSDTDIDAPEAWDVTVGNIVADPRFVAPAAACA